MIKTQTKTLLLYYSITLLLFVLDRILKFIALNFESAKSGFFSLEKNPGIAFSIPLPQVVLYILVIAILILLVSISVKYLRAKKFSLHFLTLLLIVGAASNLIDRVKFDYVIDYINLKFWPVFNLADVMIVLGVGVWIFILSKKEKRPSNIERPPT